MALQEQNKNFLVLSLALWSVIMLLFDESVLM
jgi:hypothetical protein